MKKALILHAPGTNRDEDLAYALRLADADPCIVPLSRLQEGDYRWDDFHLLALPGGFSYGDALGAGRLWALDLQTWFAAFLRDFVDSGRPVIGICNGFQALVKAGVLPGNSPGEATLTFNASGHFECRWVRLSANPLNTSPWLEDLPELSCPVAHGEGRFLMAPGSLLPAEQVALVYVRQDGRPAGGDYPDNPNGSPGDVAGVTNTNGNVLGLMPHPENHVLPYQHPGWSRGWFGATGLALFQNGLKRSFG